MPKNPRGHCDVCGVILWRPYLLALACMGTDTLCVSCYRWADDLLRRLAARVRFPRWHF